MNGIDTGTRLSAAKAQALKSSGISAVGRYLGRSLWSGLTLDEVKAIHGSGLLLFLILELDPTSIGYFSFEKGLTDAKFALSEAQFLGVPQGICIYFAVDFEAMPNDMVFIKEYFHGVHTILTGKYQVGVYGSDKVLVAMKAADYPPDKFFQTYAWSYGARTPNHILQYNNNVYVAGVLVDQDYVNDDAGLWAPTGLYQAVTAAPKEEKPVSVSKAVLLYTKEDFWAGNDVAIENGNCALFVRPEDHSVPKDAMDAGTLIVIGGPTTGHPNEVLLSGKDKYETAAAVKKHLGT